MTKSKTKALIFFFLMNIILLDFGNQLRKISYNPFFDTFQNPIFSVVHVTNSGSAFGMFKNSSYLVACFSVLVIIFLTCYIYKQVKYEDKLELIAITTFSSGALGNLIERIKYGYVIDYINLNFIEFHVFNFFDILICLGTLLYFILVLFYSKEEESDRKNYNKAK